MIANKPIVTPEMLSQFDVSGPRYTSYPTADRFVEAFTDKEYEQAITQRSVGSMVSPLSIYVHIPFCESLCFFCACNKIVTKHHEQSTKYLSFLEREIDLHVKHLGAKQRVSQLHLGGGSPTFFSDKELTRLMTKLRQSFLVSPEGGCSIEIDPRTVDKGRLTYLSALGFNRLSFGVQDFDAKVQEAVHRIQPAEQVFSLVEDARQLKFDSINIDLIYGLPKQTSSSFARTLTQVVKLKPDRIALYAYAHLPEKFKPQRRLSTYTLPTAMEKIALLSDAITTLLGAGYVYIGMDHFALPEDALAQAKIQGRLHRNFQGYSVQPDGDLIGLGVSAIGHIGVTYSQNTRTIDTYYEYLNQDRFPIAQGIALSRDDLMRRTIIMALMCQGELQYEAVELAYMINFTDYFSAELETIRTLENAGLVMLEEDTITVTQSGWYFVRIIAMVFDKYLQTDKRREQFSKIL